METWCLGNLGSWAWGLQVGSGSCYESPVPRPAFLHSISTI